jgi:hypothetical protein
MSKAFCRTPWTRRMTESFFTVKGAPETSASFLKTPVRRIGEVSGEPRRKEGRHQPTFDQTKSEEIRRISLNSKNSEEFFSPSRFGEVY